MYEKYAGLISEKIVVDDLMLQVSRDDTGEFVSLSVESGHLDVGYTDIICSWNCVDDGAVVYMKSHVLALSRLQTIGFRDLLGEVTPDLPDFISYKQTGKRRSGFSLKRLFSLKWLLK